MTEVSDVVKLGGAYKESDAHVPDPTDAYGTLDTSGTAGAAHGRVEAVTPIFEVAKAQDALTAKRALDPNDDGVSESLVVLPQGMVINDSGEKEARERVANMDVKPVEVGGPTPFQKDAAESGEEGAETAQAQQQEQGAGSTQTSTDTARQTGGESAGSNEPAKGSEPVKPAHQASSKAPKLP